MSRITSQELRKRRREFQEEAGRAFDQMLGSDGQNGLVTFTQREDRACELGDGLTRLLLEEHLAADEAAVGGQLLRGGGEQGLQGIGQLCYGGGHGKLLWYDGVW